MITGKIVNARPPDSKDSYGTQYQEIQIKENNTGKLIAGRIGSKLGYSGGEEITVHMEKRDNKGQPYWYFKRVTDTSWDAQQGSQGSSQGPQQAAQGTKGDSMTKIRSMALAYAKDLVVAEKITRPELASVANEFTAYIMTGRWIQDNPSPNSSSDWENPPPPEDNDVPW